MLKLSLKNILIVKLLTTLFFIGLVYVYLYYSVEPSYVIYLNDLPKAVEATEKVLELPQEEDDLDNQLDKLAILVGVVILILPLLYYFFPPSPR
jgi:hypothetical protein